MTSIRSSRYAFIVLVLVLAAVALMSSQDGQAAPAQTQSQSDLQWSERPQSLSLFLGMTTLTRYDHTGASLGLEYEYRLPNSKQILGVGPQVIATLYEKPDIAVAGALYFHPWRAARLTLAPGVKFGQAIDDSFLLRMGAAYDFRMGNYLISPSFNADLTTRGSNDTVARSEPALIYGLSIGYRF